MRVWSSFEVRDGSRNLGEGESCGVESERDLDLVGVLCGCGKEFCDAEAPASSSLAMDDGAVDLSLASRLSSMASTDGGGPGISGCMAIGWVRE